MFIQPPEDQYVQIGDYRIRYWAEGDGDSAVILLHGFGGYIENWLDNISALAQVRRVYAVDILGFGRSDKPILRSPVTHATKLIQAFMISQNIGRAVLVGESMGGGLALQFTLLYPEMVNRLVLADSGGLGKEAPLHLRIMSIPILGEIVSHPSREGLKTVLSNIFYDQELINDERIEEGYQMASLPGAQRAQLHILRAMINVFGAKPDIYQFITDHLGKIEIPTLILWGAQDQVLPIAHAHFAMSKLPNAQLHIFDPCGHVPNIECAHEFNTVVADFLSKP
jgi:pimeloyl-ACP methyl ester carboxylesterase